MPRGSVFNVHTSFFVCDQPHYNLALWPNASKSYMIEILIIQIFLQVSWRFRENLGSTIFSFIAIDHLSQDGLYITHLSMRAVTTASNSRLSKFLPGEMTVENG